MAIVVHTLFIFLFLMISFTSGFRVNNMINIRKHVNKGKNIDNILMFRNHHHPFSSKFPLFSKNKNKNNHDDMISLNRIENYKFIEKLCVPLSTLPGVGATTSKKIEQILGINSVL